MATINDVAREAGVSITTVSRVINNNYPVKISTKMKVEAAIKKLNFKPNPLARGLITGRSQIIGVIVPSITNWFFSSIVEDLQRKLIEENYHVQLSTTDGNFEVEQEYIKELLERKVDGLILIDPSLDNIKSGYLTALSEQLPLIIIGSHDPKVQLEIEGIFYDERNGMEKALECFVNQGKKRIALLRGQRSHSLDIREAIYSDILKAYDIGYHKVIRVKKGNNLKVVSEIEKIALKMVRSNEELPDAVIACNDLMASALISALRNNNVHVPKDMGVIGYDNTPLSYISSPGITTVDLGTEALGEQAAELLLNKMFSKIDGDNRIILDTRLVLREST
ncbi:LacI family DNA-binding transcriptional regulator [Alloiococcus sp. CFN-8]|uniref:LacI family DNA-binding transcriptional regulator n=1 Tax=Alloiococcus sp. CFN-8 TaxID=3416081 RepID=UPI003CF89AB6